MGLTREFLRPHPLESCCKITPLDSSIFFWTRNLCQAIMHFVQTLKSKKYFNSLQSNDECAPNPSIDLVMPLSIPEPSRTTILVKKSLFMDHQNSKSYTENYLCMTLGTVSSDSYIVSFANCICIIIAVICIVDWRCQFGTRA